MLLIELHETIGVNNGPRKVSSQTAPVTSIKLASASKLTGSVDH